MALRNQPYIPLYVQDFLTDEKLIECSAEATGVFIRIMCVMHKSEEYGKILLRQKDQQKSSGCLDFATKLARHLPYSVAVIENAIKELIEFDVLQINGTCLSQKRMIKDNKISVARAKAGRKGGFATAKHLAKHPANSESENEIESETEDVYDKKEDSLPF